MTKTDVYCTRCGKQFEIGEAAYALDMGTIEELPTWGDVGFFSNDGAWEEVLCADCHTEIFSSKPNRVVVEGLVSDVRAERPDEIMVIARDPIMGLFDPVEDGTVFGLLDGLPIKQLNTVKEEA